MSVYLRNVLATIVGLIYGQVQGQAIVSLTPAFPTSHDAVLITFDASQGTGGLANLGPQEKVYVHTGLTVNGQKWHNVVGDWGQDNGKGLMTRVGNSNIYTIEIAPDIREWYATNSGQSIASGASVTQLCMVFRNANGSKEGKATGGQDVFMDLATGSFSASITSHYQSGVLLFSGQNLVVTGQASAAAALSFSLDNTVRKSQVASVALNDTINADQIAEGLHTLVFSAIYAGDTIYDTLLITRHGAGVVEAIPSGRTEGIFYPDQQSVYLQLRAPYKEFIYVVGDFNNWAFLPDYRMKKSPDGQFFWIEITGLEPQKEYRFQYFIDREGLRVTDPYVEKIIDPWNDQWIQQSTYPDLLPYPAGKADGIVGVLQCQKDPYQWDETYQYTRPPKEDLIVYELLVRDFSNQRTFDEVIQKLPYLTALGVNAIELMPLAEFEGNDSWGYNPMFFMAVDKAYGPANELKRLVDSCHSRGIAVVVDVVLNHAFGLNPMVKMYFDPDAGQYGQTTAQSPWFNQVAKHPFNVGYDFNHESPATRYFVSKVLRHWLEEYKIDGYRFDLSKGFTQKNSGADVGTWGQFDQSRINILKAISDSIRRTVSDAYIILEHFADWNEEYQLANYGMMSWAKGTDIYNEATMGYASNIYDNTIQRRGWNSSAGPQNYGLVAYMESHDEERLMYKNLKYGNSSGGYSVKDLATALDRMALAACFFIPLPSAKMIYEFGELGYDYSIERCSDGVTYKEQCRIDAKPVKWEYYNDANRRNLFEVFRKLNYLKKTFPVFRDLNHYFDLGLYRKVLRFTGNELNAAILGNFNVVAEQMNPGFQAPGVWYDYLTGDSIVVQDVNAPLSFAPGEYHVYLNKKVIPPPNTFDGIPAGISGNAFTMNTLQAYPNPTSGIVHFNLPSGVQQTVEVVLYDLFGKLLLRQQFSGEAEIKINLNDLPSGMYLYTLLEKGRMYNGKLIKN
ncbi:MAG: T9SS type A sorting domain-containing protein [Bacteroidia bacterium]|nr:T9SS type A sorting domain-containing protein [Bacteroidia bacterium]